MLNIIAVDDEQTLLYLSQQAIQKALPGCSVAVFTSAQDSIDYAANTKVDVAFLDIDMGSMNGLILAKHLKDINAKTNIVFITGYTEYAVDAFAVEASGYILKPVGPEDIKRAMSSLRYPPELQSDKRVRIKCFGGFAVYVDGKPLIFPQAKAQELFAYLVHKRGSTVHNPDIAAVLWEDRPYNASVQTSVRRVRAQLMNVLRDAGVEDIIKKGWNSVAADVSIFSCDSYEYLDGDMTFVNRYAGEYMNEYSWAEFTAAYISEQMK